MAEQYTVSFTISSDTASGLDLLALVRDRVIHWATSPTRFQGPRPDTTVGRWEGPNERLEFATGTIERAGYWSLAWEHPNREDGRYRWLTGVSLATEGDAVDAYIDVRLMDTLQAFRIGGIDVERPALVPDLIDTFRCHYYGHLLFTKASLVGANNASVFTRDVLLSSDRRLPVVVVTQDSEGNPVLDPHRLQSRLAGLATVAVYDVDACWALTDALGPALTAFGGAVRVYWPHLNPADNPLWHRRWLPELAREMGDRLPRALLHLFASRFRRYADRKMFEDVLSRSRQAEQESLIQRLRSRGAGDDGAYMSLLTELQVQVETVRSERDQWQLRAMERGEEAEQLKAELEQHRQNYRLFGIGSAEAPGGEEELEVASVSEAVELAAQTLHRLRFLPSAHASASASNYNDPASVYGAFEVLDELAGERSGGPLGMSIEDWLRERNYQYAPHESQTAMGKWGDERRFLDGERTLTMEEHLKFGIDGDPQYCLRVYVWWDRDELKWIIGHVGRHLTTTQS